MTRGGVLTRAAAPAPAQPAGGSPATAVQLREVSKSFGSRHQAVTALDQVSADFAAGTFTAVMGPSGSGKSTLLHCAAGLDRPSAGQIRVAGHDLAALSDRQLTRLRRDQVGVVFQLFNLVPSLTAELNVGLPLRLAGRRPSRRAVRDALAAVGLADRAGHRPAELSGGQQQRVAIARALISRPAVVFADEPTGALDSVSSRQVLALLRGLTDTREVTVIMVTHDPVAAAVADRVVFLADGRLAGELSQPTAQSAAAAIAGLEHAGSLR